MQNISKIHFIFNTLFYVALRFSRRKANGYNVHGVHYICNLNTARMTHNKQHTCLGDVVPPQCFAGEELQSFICRPYSEDVIVLLYEVQIRGCPCSHVTKHHQYHTQQVLEQVLVADHPTVRLTCTELNQDPAHKGKVGVPLQPIGWSTGIVPIILNVNLNFAFTIPECFLNSIKLVLSAKHTFYYSI